MSLEPIFSCADLGQWGAVEYYYEILNPENSGAVLSQIRLNPDLDTKGFIESMRKSEDYTACHIYVPV